MPTGPSFFEGFLNGKLEETLKKTINRENTFTLVAIDLRPFLKHPTKKLNFDLKYLVEKNPGLSHYYMLFNRDISEGEEVVIYESLIHLIWHNEENTFLTFKVENGVLKFSPN